MRKSVIWSGILVGLRAASILDRFRNPIRSLTSITNPGTCQMGFPTPRRSLTQADASLTSLLASAKDFIPATACTELPVVRRVPSADAITRLRVNSIHLVCNHATRIASPNPELLHPLQAMSALIARNLSWSASECALKVDATTSNRLGGMS